MFTSRLLMIEQLLGISYYNHFQFSWVTSWYFPNFSENNNRHLCNKVISNSKEVVGKVYSILRLSDCKLIPILSLDRASSKLSREQYNYQGDVREGHSDRAEQSKIINEVNTDFRFIRTQIFDPSKGFSIQMTPVN